MRESMMARRRPAAADGALAAPRSAPAVRRYDHDCALTGSRGLEAISGASHRAELPPAADGSTAIPSGLLERIQKTPAEDAPAFDPTKPETDFQLQQALVLVRGMAGQPQRRASR